jgi:hypothetical protein
MKSHARWLAVCFAFCGALLISGVVHAADGKLWWAALDIGLSLFYSLLGTFHLGAMERLSPSSGRNTDGA